MDALTISIAANFVLGVVLLAILHRSSGRESERLIEPEQALARYRTRYPTANGRVNLAADGQTALIELDDDTLGLVARCGRRWSVRALEPRDIAGVDRAGDAAITVRFADFGWPRARIQLADAATCQRLIERLAAMRAASASAREWGGHRA